MRFLLLPTVISSFFLGILHPWFQSTFHTLSKWQRSFWHIRYCQAYKLHLWTATASTAELQSQDIIGREVSCFSDHLHSNHVFLEIGQSFELEDGFSKNEHGKIKGIKYQIFCNKYWFFNKLPVLNTAYNPVFHFQNFYCCRMME